MGYDFEKEEKQMMRWGFGMVAFALLANLIFWGGLLWLAFFLYGRYVG